MPRKRTTAEEGDTGLQPLSKPDLERASKRSKSDLRASMQRQRWRRDGLDQFLPYPIHQVNRLLEPGPVVLVTTGSLANRTHNIMTMGFHMMIQHEEPTLIGACIGPWDKSYDTLKKTGECVLAIPAVEMLEKAVDIGNCSGEDVDKWETFGINPVPAPEYVSDSGSAEEEEGKGEEEERAQTRAPLVGGEDVVANIQCVVQDRALVAKYNLWVLRVVGAWVNRDMDLEYGQGSKNAGDEKNSVGGRELGVREMKMAHHRGDGRFVVDGKEVDLRARMVKWKEFQD
ncbi:flavin reductase [Aspergillus heteromorphus CBS 117.55]|uniref:Flavin reductase n=1 Tax=Aspergillus heteromorphus CBS 117.55 TaxID=1448321 RepID=A0A317WPZ2_9EURO|nr:flavin reductase [Aspergillus heteromorphus CBS 117.55]PWY88499.1 flavin reductase [Aspergillus heteromorphus CBS 117.55]